MQASEFFRKENLKVFLLKKSWKYALGGVICCFVLFLLLNAVFPFRPSPEYSRIIRDRNGEILHVFLTSDDKWRLNTELEEITPELRKTILYKEDRFFYYHPGVNFPAVCRAFIGNFISGRRRSGASTVTMQVVRLLEPRERTYVNKVIEAFRAFQLEWNFSKDEILRLYLNLVPYGGNVEGVKSASLLYFGQEPQRLSLAQVTALTIIPNRPTSLALGKHNLEIEDAGNRWLDRFKKASLFSEEEIEDAKNERLKAKFLGFPKKAPHLSYRLHLNADTSKTNLLTTISAADQELCRKLTFEYTQKLKPIGIHNASVMVIDNQTREVRAYVGSSDFKERKHSGQVDGLRAVRSPGSALKPLIYGLAFDAGFLTPKVSMQDIATDFDGYAPENFDRKYHGKVSVEDALATSLNVPAVLTLQELGVIRMTETLKALRFRNIALNENNLGLSLALGGCGVSPEEMASLYTAFACGGLYRPLKILQDSSFWDSETPHLPDSVRILSQEATYMISEILTKVERPDMPSDYRNSLNVPKIAWKTGTSYGRRDAWSIGYNSRYTVAVRVGNFSGTGSPYLTGSGVATPLLFKIFTTLDYNAANTETEKPEGLDTRTVCSETGLVPADFCKKRVTDYFIPGVSKSHTCNHMKYAFVSPEEDMTYCSVCLPENNYKKKLYPNISPDMAAHYEAQGIPYEKQPKHNPLCTKVFANDNAPIITSPSHKRSYIMPEADSKLQLSCQAAADAEKVFWYINDKFLKEAPRGERIFFKPPKGKVKISCSDDKGRNSDVEIVVK